MPLRNAAKTARLSEMLWIAPFLCIGLIALGQLRPMPHLPPPAHYRTVVGTDGVPVRIAEPFMGIAEAPPAFVEGYLEDTRLPELLVYAGNSDRRKGFSESMMSLVYPQVAKNDNLWNARLFRNTSSPFLELETLLSYNPGVYLGCGSSVSLMRNIGLPVLISRAGCGGPQKVMSCAGSPISDYWAHYPEGPIFISLRVDAALAGHPELAEARIASYCRALTDLHQELQPSTLPNRPRVLMEGEYKGDFPRAGVVDASAERRIPGDDDERTLIIDPDMIFIIGTNASPKIYMQDPRFRGLKAVQDRRVYRWSHGGLTEKPAKIRWLAEIAHPERLQPKARQLLRDRMFSEFGYRLSEDQIDHMLNVEENSNSAGAERFTRGYQAHGGAGGSQ
jgi:ABC-type Fe3+-hydroxamate transport system substrate-binding protein